MRKRTSSIKWKTSFDQPFPYHATQEPLARDREARHAGPDGRYMYSPSSELFDVLMSAMDEVEPDGMSPEVLALCTRLADCTATV